MGEIRKRRERGQRRGKLEKREEEAWIKAKPTPFRHQSSCLRWVLDSLPLGK